MNLTLLRSDFLSTGIFGNIFNADRSLYLYTAEHSYSITPDPLSLSTNYSPKVPQGTYFCQRRHSPEFGYDLFWITNVPDHDWIELHVGNFPQKDSAGCVLLGENRNGDMITQSKMAFLKFMNFLEGLNTFNLTIS